MESNYDKNMTQGDINQPLPPELDWDHMKAGIFDKMEAIEQAEASLSKGDDDRKRMGFFMILLLGLACCLFFISQYDAKVPYNEVQEGAQVPAIASTTESSNESEKEMCTTQVERDAHSCPEKNQQTNPLAYENTQTTSVLNQDSHQIVKAQIEGSPSLSDTYSKKQDFQESILRANQSETTLSISATETKALSDVEEKQFAYSIPKIPVLRAPANMMNKIHLEAITPSLSTQQIYRAYPSSIPQLKPTHQLIFEGGITFWKPAYGSTQPGRAQYESQLPSFQLQGHYMKSLNENFFFMAGLQYQRLESRFDYNTSIENYPITLQDTIIQVRNNLATREQTIVRGDVEQLVEAERIIRHYNTTQLFKVSAGIGKSWHFRSFQTDLYLGGALNTVVQNQGRSLYQGEIIDYYGASNSIFQNQMTVDGMVGARLHYFFTRKVGIMTDLQLQRSLMNWSNQEAVNFYPTSFGLQWGLSYSLK